MPAGPGLRPTGSNKSLEGQDSEDISGRLKAVEAKVEGLQKQKGQDTAFQAALAAGRVPSGGEETFMASRLLTSGQRSSFSEEYVEALMQNLTALNGLNAGDLVRRLDRMEAMLEELLGQRAASPHPPTLTAMTSDTAGPPSPQESPGTQPPPPTSPAPSMQMGPLASVKEECGMSRQMPRELPKSSPASPASPGDEGITSEETKSHLGTGAKLIEVMLERDKQQPSWGLLWDRKSFTRKKRVLEALMPSTPAHLWNEERRRREEDHLQKGDELVKLDGRGGWEACNELPNLHKVKLTFQRVEAKARRQSKGKLDGSMQASRQKNLGSTSSNGRESASLPSPTMQTSPPATPLPPDLGATWENPQLQGRRNSDPDAIQVLKESLEDIAGTGLEDRPPATPPETEQTQEEVRDPPLPSQGGKERDIIVERIMEHSVMRRSSGKPSIASLMTENRFQELTKLANYLSERKVEPALQIVVETMAKTSPGPEEEEAEPVHVTAAHFLLDLLAHLRDCKEKEEAKLLS